MTKAARELLCGDLLCLVDGAYEVTSVSWVMMPGWSYEFTSVSLDCTRGLGYRELLIPSEVVVTLAEVRGYW